VRTVEGGGREYRGASHLVEGRWIRRRRRNGERSEATVERNRNRVPGCGAGGVDPRIVHGGGGGDGGTGLGGGGAVRGVWARHAGRSAGGRGESGGRRKFWNWDLQEKNRRRRGKKSWPI
jgi:hypothetical protein